MSKLTAVSAPMKEFLRELPKCEHHVHVEGTLSPSLLFKLVTKHQVELPKEFPKTPEELKTRYDNFADLDDFLYFYYVGMKVLIDEEDFYQLAWDYFTVASQQGLHHIELFFDPQGHLERNIQFDLFISGFLRAAKRAEQELAISFKLIMCLLRHLPVENCLATLEQAHPYFDDTSIHGLGLDSSEKPFPPHLFVDCYEQIRTKYPTVGLTAHAGEEGGANYVLDSLDLLKVSRIDHGINSAQDDELLKRLARDQTLLSVCPISNLKLQVVSNLSELPLQKFLDYGVPFSINSDDPAYFNGYILDNYILVHEHFNFDMLTWCLIAKNGIKGSWIDDEYKQQLLAKVDEVYSKHKHIEAH